MTVTGDLTAQHSQSFKEQLEKCLRQGSNFEISLKEVTAMDVTAIQLLQCMRNDLKSIELMLTITPPKQEGVSELLKKSGLQHIIQLKS